MRIAVLLPLAALAAPASAERPEPVVGALTPDGLRIAAPGLAACLAAGGGAVVTGAVVRGFRRERVLAGLLHPDGTRSRCEANLAPSPAVTSLSAMAPDAPPMIGRSRFAADRRCAGARRVNGADGRALGYLEAPPCR